MALRSNPQDAKLPDRACFNVDVRSSDGCVPGKPGNSSIGQPKRGTHMSADGLLIILLVGLVAGWLAGLIVQGTGFGLIADICIGIVGALIGELAVPATRRGTAAAASRPSVARRSARAVLLLCLRLSSRRRAVVRCCGRGRPTQGLCHDRPWLRRRIGQGSTLVVVWGSAHAVDGGGLVAAVALLVRSCRFHGISIRGRAS